MTPVQIILSLAMGVLAFMLARYTSDREARRARQASSGSYSRQLLNRAALRMTAYARPLRSRRTVARARKDLERALRER